MVCVLWVVGCGFWVVEWGAERWGWKCRPDDEVRAADTGRFFGWEEKLVGGTVGYVRRRAVVVMMLSLGGTGGFKYVITPGAWLALPMQGLVGRVCHASSFMCISVTSCPSRKKAVV